MRGNQRSGHSAAPGGSWLILTLGGSSIGTVCQRCRRAFFITPLKVPFPKSLRGCGCLNIGWNPSALVRALLIYVVCCFAALQVVDLLQAPLGLPDTSGRWLLLLMLAAAPLLAAMVAWRAASRQPMTGFGPGPADGQTRFLVGPAQLDTAARQICFDGEPADVQPKVFDLIVYLVRARDRVVSKDELFDAIWPSVVVTEASLTQSIKRARDLFRQHGFPEDVIRTVARKGYQFNHEVSAAQSSVTTAPPAWQGVAVQTALVALLALGLGVWAFRQPPPVSPQPGAYNNSLAVLPFSNLSTDADFGYFTDGLTETLTNSLTRVRGLRVIATGSAARFREPGTEYLAIGEQLRVDHLVQGSVQRDGDQLRITARLIRVEDGAQLWSQIFNRQFDDVFSLHDDIARATVQQMSGILAASLKLPDGAPALATDSDDSEAYRLLLRGQALRKRGANQDLGAAATLFRQALDLRPDYTAAMVALADATRLRATTGDLPRESGFAEALVLARRALSIDPELAEAWVQIGEIQHRHFWEFDAAAESYRRAMAINPGGASAHSAYGRFLAKSGREEAAVAEARIALDLDPLSANAASSLVIRLVRAGQLPEARSVLDDFKTRHPEHADVPWLEANWHIRSGSYSDALQWTALETLDYLRLCLSAIALNHLGRTGQAELALQELIDTDAQGAAFQIAEVYAQNRQVDLAFEWLERAFRQGDPGLSELYSSLNLASLYGDPRFADIGSRVGLPPPPEQF